ncbi:MAG TPA: TraB/GumN family protein [Rhodanobacteraceae bacterium]|nr:TraB/GumN family protein [Rhodanobacteraceae bacterium]
MPMTIKVRALAVALCMACLSPGAMSEPASRPAPSGHAVTLGTVVVTGVVPGPALWKVSKDGHVMWVLGITSPLPRHIHWDSTNVDHLIATSGQVLEPPGYSLYLQDDGSGEAVTVQALDRAKVLPAGKTLQDVLPPDLYERWIVARKKYLHGPRGWGVNHLRPILAATELYDAALSRTDLTPTGMVEDAVQRAARKHGVPTVSTEYVLQIKHANQNLKHFTQASDEGLQCMRSTLDAIDRNFPQATAMANAWSTGDLPTLRTLLSAKQHDPCMSEYSDMWGISDISERVRLAWVTAAKQALSRHAQSVALLPMTDLTSGDSYLGTLAQDGYSVLAPTSWSEQPVDPPAAAPAPAATSGQTP